jgi:transposase-like protein
MKHWKDAHCSVCEKDFKIEKIWLEIAEEIPKSKQMHIDYRCPNYNNHIRIQRQKEVSQVPKEVRQKVLDLFRSGKTIGQTREELNLSLDVTCEIILQNIEDIPILRSEAI